MIDNEMYLKRHLVRLEASVRKERSHLQQAEPESEINEHEVLKLENYFEQMRHLYDQVKIFYAEENDEAWIDEYRSRINILQRGIVELKDRLDVQALDKEKKLEKQNTDKNTDSDTYAYADTGNDTEKFDSVVPDGKNEIENWDDIVNFDEKIPLLEDEPIQSTDISSTQDTTINDIKKSMTDQRTELFSTLDKNKKDLGSKTEKDLNLQKRTQEELADELLGMSKVLKNNTMLFGDLLQKDQDVTEDASDIVLKNSTRLQKEGSRLNKFRASAWSTTGLTWMAIAVVLLVFAMLVMVIKVVPKRKA